MEIEDIEEFSDEEVQKPLKKIKYDNTYDQFTKRDENPPAKNLTSPYFSNSNGLKPNVNAKWSWKPDKGEWVSYSFELTKKLEEAYSSFQQGKPAKAVPVDEQRFIDVKAMLQRRFDDPSKVRMVKREVSTKLFLPQPRDLPKAPSEPHWQKKKPPTQTNSKNSISITWQWKSDQGWVDYSLDMIRKLEKSFESSPKSRVTVDKERFVDLSRMVQGRFDNPSKIRLVQRKAADVVWYWRDKDWTAYPPETSQRIETAYLARRPTVPVDSERYIDIENMIQIRIDDKSRHRYVKRRGPKPQWRPLTKAQLTQIEKNRQEALKRLEASQGKPKAIIDLSDDSDNSVASVGGAFDFADSSDEESSDYEDLNEYLRRRRKHYKCGKFVVLSEIESWEKMIQRIAGNPEKTFYSPSRLLNKKVSLWKGDITSLEIDAIVNAAKPSLMGGGGIDGAIHKAAGRKLLEECINLDGCEVGDAKITGGHKLPAKFVIHTVGPIGEKKKKLESCYRRIFALTGEYELRSVALCCISTGIYGFPKEPAAHIALKAAREWLETNNNHQKVDRIIFCMFLTEEFAIYKKIMPRYFPPQL